MKTNARRYAISNLYTSTPFLPGFRSRSAADHELMTNMREEGIGLACDDGRPSLHRAAMKPFLLVISAVACLTIHAVAGELRAVQIKFHDYPRCALSKDERRVLEKLKVGMTRKELEKDFSRNFGLWDGFREPHLLSSGRLPLWRTRWHVGADVVFKPVAMSEAIFTNPDRRVAWLRKHPRLSEKPDDIVRAFSKPYESGPVID